MVRVSRLESDGLGRTWKGARGCGMSWLRVTNKIAGKIGQADERCEKSLDCGESDS